MYAQDTCSNFPLLLIHFRLSLICAFRIQLGHGLGISFVSLLAFLITFSVSSCCFISRVVSVRRTTTPENTGLGSDKISTFMSRPEFNSTCLSIFSSVAVNSLIVIKSLLWEGRGGGGGVLTEKEGKWREELLGKNGGYTDPCDRRRKNRR